MTPTPTAPRVRLPRAILSAVVLAGLAAGCTSDSGSWKKGQKPALATAKESGSYQLMSGKDVVATYDLEAGEALGFRTGADGGTDAVAGIYSIPLSAKKSYRWKLAK